MIAYLEKVLNVRRNELGPASMLFLYLFLMIGCYYMGTSVGKSLYLKALTKTYLPHAIIGTALVVGAFVFVYIRLSQHVRLEWMVIGLLLFFSLSFALFWWLTRLHSKWVYPPIYFWVYAMGALGPAMGWTLANYALTTREARRVFGFIGAGGILGATSAGLFTFAATRRGAFRSETLLLVIAVGLAVSALVVRMLFRTTRRMAGAGLPASGGKEAPKSISQVWATIRDSRYLSLITALIAVGCATTTILDYQFTVIANARYASKEQLTAFFGVFLGVMGLAAFLVQMLLTGRLLRRFGIRVTLFVLPVVFLGGSLGVLLWPVLLAASILKASHLVLRFSLDKSTAELLYLPVAPPDIKSQIKSFIDGFIWRSADGVAGVALLLFANKFKFGPGQVSLVNFVFLTGWIVVAYGVRREYLNVLRMAIERRSLDPDRIATAGVLDSTTTEVLARALERGGEQQVLYGLSLFEVGRETGWHPALRGLLEHPSPAVRQRALRLLSDAGDRGIVPQVEKLLRDPSLEVRTESLHYLVVQTGRDPLDLLSGESDFPDYSVQGSVVAYLARSGTPEHFTAAKLIFQTMMSRTDSEAAHSRAEAARVLGVIPPPWELHGELMKLLRDQNPDVVEQALLAAGRIRSRDFLPPVVEKLGDLRLVGAARAALVQYGERAVGTLKDYLNDPGVAMSVRKQIPHVLSRIPTSESAKVLADSLIQSDPGLRYDVMKGLNKLCRHDPGLLPPAADIADMLDAEIMGFYRSFQILAALDPSASSLSGIRPVTSVESLLARALRERMEHEFERIFRLLALLYSARDVYNAYIGLSSRRPQLQANALEVLENMLRPDLYRRLAYGLDPEIPLPEKLKFAERLCHTRVNSKKEALRILLHTDDAWLAACALHAIGELKVSELQADVQRMAHDRHPLLAETWEWATARLRAATA